MRYEDDKFYIEVQADLLCIGRKSGHGVCMPIEKWLDGKIPVPDEGKPPVPPISRRSNYGMHLMDELDVNPEI